MANTFSAEVLATSGYDSVTVDMQHGLVDFQKSLKCFKPFQLIILHRWLGFHGMNQVL